MTNPTEPKERKCCAWCGKPIKGPLWKRWCSDACKMKAYRDRRDRKLGKAKTVTTTRNTERADTMTQER